jgi:murein DD-endopeptidase MepM/ murein hydrolase activator NlpD
LLTPSVALAFSLTDLFGSFAQGAGTAQPIVPDPGLALLDHPTNSNPNAGSTAINTDMTGGTAFVAHEGPSGTVADVISRPANDTISVYTVKPNDTLSTIANTYGVSVNTIIWANNLKSAKDIHSGQSLLILPVSGVQHTVTKGETLASIAKKFKGDADEIATFNGLGDGAVLAAGDVLIIPGGEISVTSAPTHTGSGASPAAPRGLAAGGGKNLVGFWTNPLPGAILTQGIHDANAVDLGARSGTPILAAADGTVIFVSANGSYNHGWGNDVIIDHGNGTQTLYAHMSSVAASVGDSVSQGEVIGYVGRTGEATGPHLHFEIRGARNPFGACTVGRVCRI